MSIDQLKRKYTTLVTETELHGTVTTKQRDEIAKEIRRREGNPECVFPNISKECCDFCPEKYGCKRYKKNKEKRIFKIRISHCERMLTEFCAFGYCPLKNACEFYERLNKKGE